MSRTLEYPLSDLTEANGGADLGLLFGPGPAFVAAKKGNGAEFSEPDGYLSVVIPSGTKAVAMWACKHTADTFRLVLGAGGNDQAIWFGYSEAAGNRMRLFNGSQITYPATTFALNEWHRIMWANDGTNSYLIVNGTVVGQGADASGIPADTYGIGGQDNTEARTFPGIIDEFYTYNDTLANQAAVEALAASDLAYAQARGALDRIKYGIGLGSGLRL